MRFLLISFIFLSLFCMAEEGYRVYDYHNQLKVNTNNVPTVFVLDYSNSMNERIMGETKYNILKRCFSQLIQRIPEETPIGVRIYGHRWGLTNMDACRASAMIEGINSYNRDIIPEKLSRFRPRGMTPITYSLKETIKDFPHNNSPKHIVLVTDGGENCDESPCDYVMELIKRRKDVKIDVIAIRIRNEDDLDQLACTANVTSGKLYNVETEAELIKRLNETVESKKEVNATIIKH